MRSTGWIVMLGALTLASCERDVVAPQPSPLPSAEMGEFYSHASARDGDDLEISIRMNGFDTPERGAMCGDVNVWGAARDALNDIVRDQRVDCVLIGHDQQDERMVARCAVDGQDIGERMVEQGWARDWPRYSGGRYADAEVRAREARRGVWGMECPADLWGTRDYATGLPQ